MKWTNKYGMPEAVAQAIMNDPYEAQRMEDVVAAALLQYGIKPEMVRSGQIPTISVTTLIKPVRMVALERHHDSQLEMDVCDGWHSLTGRAKHYLLEQIEHDPRLKERRLTVFVGGVLVTGATDLIYPDGKIDDYKEIAVDALDRGIKDEWTAQLNFNAWLIRELRVFYPELPMPTQLRIVPLMRDWKKRDRVKHGYPQAPSVYMDGIPLWSHEEAEKALTSRLRAHMMAKDLDDDSLPECTDKDTWVKPDSWAVQREGSDRATKVYSEEFGGSLAVAMKDAEVRNQKIKKDKNGELREQPYTVSHRPGEVTRCLNFCSAAPFCGQFKSWKSAAWGSK